MSVLVSMDPKQLAGRAPESLTWGERQALVGKIMAVKIYSPRGGLPAPD